MGIQLQYRHKANTSSEQIHKKKTEHANLRENPNR